MAFTQMRMPRFVARLITLLWLIALPLKAQSLLVNGSFENPVVPPGGSLLTPELPGWEVEGNTALVNEGVWPAVDGRQSLNLAAGSVWQSFPTIPGKEYELSFYYANHPDIASANAHGVIWSDLRGIPFFFLAHSGSTRTNMQYTLFQRTFVAAESTTTLRISNLTPFPPPNTNNTRGIIVDNVVVTRIPDPDADADGVPDDEDECPDTPPGATIDASGCSLDQLVPCEGPASGGVWRNHGEYVAARLRVIQQFRKEGLLNQRQAQALFLEAIQSSCGNRAFGKRTR